MTCLAERRTSASTLRSSTSGRSSRRTVSSTCSLSCSGRSEMVWWRGQREGRGERKVRHHAQRNAAAAASTTSNRQCAVSWMTLRTPRHCTRRFALNPLPRLAQEDRALQPHHTRTLIRSHDRCVPHDNVLPCWTLCWQQQAQRPTGSTP